MPYPIKINNSVIDLKHVRKFSFDVDDKTICIDGDIFKFNDLDLFMESLKKLHDYFKINDSMFELYVHIEDMCNLDFFECSELIRDKCNDVFISKKQYQDIIVTTNVDSIVYLHTTKALKDSSSSMMGYMMPSKIAKDIRLKT